uniref:G-protein coupled receptors family 1 profile domain-containing protein n=1 Tax=Clytia hemisphaerica TaxID=252671 RepID=A0A7M5WS96_9CNID
MIKFLFEVQVVLTVIYGIIFMLGTMGNVAVIVHYTRKIIKERNRSNLTKYLIVNLAVADFIASFTVPIGMIQDIWSLYNWHLGEVSCKLITPLYIISLGCSIWTMLAIALARYRAISYPFKSTKPSKTIILSTISGTWVFTILASFPYAYTLRFDAKAYYQCTSYWSEKPYFKYFLIFYIVTIFVPTLTIAYFFTCCYIKIKENTMRLKSLGDPKIQKQRLNRDRRRNRLFIAIVGVFTLLITPYWLFYLVYTYINAYRSDLMGDPIIYFGSNYGLFTLATFNSVVNPFIYAKIRR